MEKQINDELLNYLETIDNFISNSPKNKFKYRSIYHFLIEHGQFFKPPKEPYKKAMKKKQCYYNAYQTVLEIPFVQYAEGIAWSIIPTMHAWTVDSKGYVIDPTWDNGISYFGVIFPSSYVTRITFSNGYYGPVIDNWQNKWPLLTGEHEFPMGVHHE